MSTFTVTGGLTLVGGSVTAPFINIPPTWTTAAGSLGSMNEDATITSGGFSILAVDSDGLPVSPVVYDIVADPDNFFSTATLNATTGAITGPTITVTSNKIFAFTARVSDGQDQVTREFSITVNNTVASAFVDALTSLSLTTNLKLCLDAGDINSYVSGQDWVDVSGAGNADEFHRGTAAGADGSDPTFNGVAGSLTSSEYWSFDGADKFVYGASNETWMGGSTSGGLHHNGAQWAVMYWIYHINGAQAIWGTQNQGGASRGNLMRVNGSDDKFSVIHGDGGAFQNIKTNSVGLKINAWNLVGCSLDEAGGVAASHLYLRNIDGTTDDTFDGTYSSTSANAASYPMRIGDQGNSGEPVPSGTRMAGFMMFNGGLLTLANMNDFYDATKDRFGL